MTLDPWTQGYRTALNHGASYSDNPHKGEPAATAWAFGASEGMKDRNRNAFGAILESLNK